MALTSGTLSLLASLKEAGHNLSGSGAVIEIGAQQLSNSVLEATDLLARLSSDFNVPQDRSLPAPLSDRMMLDGNVEHLDAAAPRASQFWEWLGYRYACIDVDGSPGSIPLDLNYDDVPESEMGKYQIVTNFGTTEHVANQLNAFKVIHDLTAVGGFMMHGLPSQGWPNHGLVNYNPKFFWMLARSNFYEWVYMVFDSLYSYYPVPENIIEDVARYDARAAEDLKIAQLSDYTVICVFKKTRNTPYVAPLDVPTGTRTDNKILEERYWSVLKPPAVS